MSLYQELPLFSLQAKVYEEITTRFCNSEPSILWAGKQSGKTEICRRISESLGDHRQIAIGNDHSQFSGFLIDSTDFFQPHDVVIEFGHQLERIWETITPDTVVFVDDLFNIPFSEEVFNHLAHATGLVIATASDGFEDAGWDINVAAQYLIGPYSSWELNPLLDRDILRKERPKTKVAKVKFNNECVASVDQIKIWRDWACNHHT